MKGAAAMLLLAAGCGRPDIATSDDLALERLAEADAHFEAKRWGAAAAAYEDVVLYRDLVRKAWLRLSASYAEMGEREKAVGALDRWLRIDPTDEEARKRRDALVR